jgi:hypothetical protein
MANENAAVALNDLHDAIIDRIKMAFPAFKLVDDYPIDRKPKALPACMIELEEFEQANDQDPGTGQQALDMRWNARIILGFRTANVGRQTRLMAASLAAFIHLNRFGQKVGAAQVMGAYPDGFEPDLDEYVVFRVEWHQVGHFGVSAYADDDLTQIPENVFVGYDPSVGAGREGDYVQVAATPVAVAI